MDEPRACENQAQIKNYLRSPSEPACDAAEYHLGGRLPGADIKHIDGASGMEQAVQKLCDAGQQKKEKGGRHKAFQRFSKGEGIRPCREFRICCGFVRRRFVHRGSLHRRFVHGRPVGTA